MLAYAKVKAGMSNKSYEQLSNFMKDLKGTNKDYYLQKEIKVKDTQNKVIKMKEKTKKA